MYLATKKIGKNNPKATEIEADNSKRTLWNQTVDRAIVTGVSKSEIMQIKKERITDKIVESVWLYGNRPNLLSSIIGTAIAVLELLISKVFLKTLELADKVISKELEARPENTDFKEQKAVPEESRKQKADRYTKACHTAKTTAITGSSFLQALMRNLSKAARTE